MVAVCDNQTRKSCNDSNVPYPVTAGVCFLENSGRLFAVSGASCVGPFQLSRGAAREMGLRVDDEVDERYDLEKNVAGGVKYLEKLYTRDTATAGSWLLTTTGYCWGTGNISSAIRRYMSIKSLKGNGNGKGEFRDLTHGGNEISAQDVVATLRKDKYDSKDYPYLAPAGSVLVLVARDWSRNVINIIDSLELSALASDSGFNAVSVLAHYESVKNHGRENSDELVSSLKENLATGTSLKDSLAMLPDDVHQHMLEQLGLSAFMTGWRTRSWKSIERSIKHKDPVSVLCSVVEHETKARIKEHLAERNKE